MKYQVEVCIDNIESLHNAIAGGATRIELCSSLALGGLTPSAGLMYSAGRVSPIPVYAMIRPREGDFFYHDDELGIMAQDIRTAHQANLQGVVLGLLNADGTIDVKRSKPLIELAHSLGLGVTFHRAFDHCVNPEHALEEIIALGCERILTSGLARNAYLGIERLAQLVKQSAGRISIMAGAGVNALNVAEIALATGVNELHLSAKTTRPSEMLFIRSESKMGAADCDDFIIPVTSRDALQQTVHALAALNSILH
ncbi:copper homeostasis protein CutC [Vibrio cholerae]|uniref:copper homeostasis protein CutC n=1 Tax=Vibrio cholerae TaxID=666 RepID=UPI00115AFF25|nr:copper homeostasis protein CutC [Vibrio cholerae]EGQ7944155.1 copper homeostasis protein CutC [Vibrio cholerae]EGQ9188708.1 copper homeostasis protein CutC [Vibrio cholerae]EGR4143464.1 copper homeostasis protein CutC [Vibrio cholerae]EJL6613074.1 copper homeostasis protein CutC [Vibrio cholerae]EKF9302134.1 copper homeostasis protein CutC [Vibrio cholerae]